MTRETVARASCHCCGSEVAVKTNVSGKAYYNCDHCGVKVQHTWTRSSDAYLAKIAPQPARKSEPAVPAASSTPPAKPAPAPARSAGTVLG